MKRKILTVILIVELCVLLAAAGLLVWLHLNIDRQPEASVTMPPETASVPTVTIPAVTDPPATVPPATVPPTTEELQPVSYRLTFAGDCTLGTLHDLYDASSCFPAVVGENYAYPFQNVQQWFASDDFTMVNLEGPLTEEGTPADKTYVFRGDPKLAQILPAGSVEYVSLANNHSEDFGAVGYQNTEKALDAAGVGYGGNGQSNLVTTERGLKVGIFTVAFYVDPDYMAQELAELQKQGAEVVIASFHWGTEGSYRHSWDQEALAHAAIDAGADIVFGHHPHVLQEIEQYADGIIFYSLGNFAFGGNGNPQDYDTALISQEVIREPDGRVHLGETEAIPCSISSDFPNNYQPTPAAPDSERYRRVMDKLSGSFAGPDVSRSVRTQAAEEGKTA